MQQLLSNCYYHGSVTGHPSNPGPTKQLCLFMKQNINKALISDITDIAIYFGTSSVSEHHKNFTVIYHQYAVIFLY